MQLSLGKKAKEVCLGKGDITEKNTCLNIYGYSLDFLVCSLSFWYRHLMTHPPYPFPILDIL